MPQVIRDIEIHWASPLWQASRKGWLVGDHNNVGLGKTPIEALAHLLEMEMENE
jgi:hypothetical protein